MKVKDRIEQLKKDNFHVDWNKHEFEMLPDDWIRIYESADPEMKLIDFPVYDCDLKDINNIPENYLEMEYDDCGSMLIGGTLTLDLVIRITREELNHRMAVMSEEGLLCYEGEQCGIDRYIAYYENYSSAKDLAVNVFEYPEYELGEFLGLPFEEAEGKLAKMKKFSEQEGYEIRMNKRTNLS